MLSEAEYYTAIYNLNNIPSDIHRDHRQNYKQTLKKQIKEYEYNLKYGKFEPLPYIPYFINRTTSEPVLNQLIQAASSVSEFIIDTESINIYKKHNKPVLMQIQIILPYNLSLVMLVEMCHLPHINTSQFALIKQLFNNIFTSNKTNYIWGTSDELIHFIKFKLFSREQLESATSINLQQHFKLYWHKKFKHYRRSSTATDTLEFDCKCEQCIGKNLSEPWSLQDSTAHLLNEYLPKLLTRGKFNIGLDNNLFNLDFKEIQYRQELTLYALNDCLSMQRILYHMKNDDYEFNINLIKNVKSKFIGSLLSSSDDENDDEINYSQLKSSAYEHQPITPSVVILKNQTTTYQELPVNDTSKSIPPIVGLNRYSSDWESKGTNQINTNETDWTNRQASSNNNDNDDEENETKNCRPKLSEEEIRKKHNRKCTIKQRYRYYRNEIIIKNIDNRFSVRAIKDILRYKNISFFAVNKFISKTTNELTLAIGIRDTSKLSSYKMELRTFIYIISFSTIPKE